MKISQEIGVDPLMLACLCKKESNFNQNELGSSGKGIAQITSILTDDMYLRPEVFDDKLKELIRQYKSLNKVFEAKKADPNLNLGDFGEMLYKYQTPDKLFKALQKDRNLNLKCAAYNMRFQLKEANGDVHKALENYNRTSAKKEYADKIMEYMRTAKSFCGLNVYY